MGRWVLGLAMAVVLVSTVGIERVSGVLYTVGDSEGWGFVDYNAWLLGKTFYVGDELLFTYVPSDHDVTEVSKADYDSCFNNPLNIVYRDGSSKITLKLGDTTRYFICGAPGHCAANMKIAITITPSSPTSPPTPLVAPSIPPVAPSLPPVPMSPPTVAPSLPPIAPSLPPVSMSPPTVAPSLPPVAPSLSPVAPSLPSKAPSLPPPLFPPITPTNTPSSAPSSTPASAPSSAPTQAPPPPPSRASPFAPPPPPPHRSLGPSSNPPANTPSPSGDDIPRTSNAVSASGSIIALLAPLALFSFFFLP